MPKIISIHSFRGGTGKSNLTANLAVDVAMQGRRVGIVDTDIQSPGIHVLFGFDEDRMSRTLNDYLWGKCGIEEAAYDVGATLADGGQPLRDGAVYLIPSSIRAGEIARVIREGYDVSTLNDGFHEAISRLRLDFLFIDTHPGLNEETLLSIAISDVLALVLRPDRQDFQGTAVAIEVARKLDVPELLLIVNKVLPEYAADDVRRQVEGTYNASVVAILPLSEDVVRNASSDIFSLRQPDHPWSQGVRSVAERLLP
jgi:MinD-like ATPase involved in chromosome partitioning or flagellar assembly